MNLQKQILHIDGEEIVCEHNVKSKNVVILHGAGQSSRVRFYALAEECLKAGVGVVLFDFSSHGESSGVREELSLRRRILQARGVIDELVPSGDLCIAGFSMGAQTVCDLLPMYPNRIKSILLGCPAVYTVEAADMCFDGREFTRKIREEESWRRSASFGALRRFRGKTVIAMGDQDIVIPKDMVVLLRQQSANVIYREYKGVTHQLAVWLAEHPKECSALVRDFLM